MASRTLKIHAEALLEAESSLTWYRTRSLRAADSFLNTVEQAIDTILESPNRWPKDRDGFRQYQLRSFPFVLFYRDTPSAVEIIAVAHASRNPGYWKSRLP